MQVMQLAFGFLHTVYTQDLVEDMSRTFGGFEAIHTLLSMN
jgi:hypothetical protein